jgi:RNA polymerase sigma-70 factor (ECF subfamily)
LPSPLKPLTTPPAEPPVSVASAPSSDASRADDQAQVNRAAQGDRAAFAALVRRHQRGLFGFLGRMGIGQAQAQDLAQESFLRVWRHLDQFDPRRAAFSTWLYTIARRLALNWLDRAEHTLLVSAGGEGDEPDLASAAVHAVRPGGWGDDPLRQLEQERERAWLQVGMRRLPLADRSLLALAYVHDMSLAQIAQIEGVSEAAAKARLHRARGRLREILVALDGDAGARGAASATATAAVAPTDATAKSPINSTGETT